jgi:hypothetical protein
MVLAFDAPGAFFLLCPCPSHHHPHHHHPQHHPNNTHTHNNSGAWMMLYVVEAIAILSVLKQYPDDSRKAVRARAGGKFWGLSLEGRGLSSIDS